ncbi:MAG TPA: hypothetical protein VJ895_02880 [Candidatus Nanoarchaeia archaeon]|nr:hypothetical protein [Candidatus Nanoarchaeia archaeon]
MREDLLKKRAQEVKEENNINEEISSKIFENKNTNEENKKEIKENETKESSNNIIQEKQKKLLEKIFYEANVYKKEGKLEDYEKKLIE